MGAGREPPQHPVISVGWPRPSPRYYNYSALLVFYGFLNPVAQRSDRLPSPFVPVYGQCLLFSPFVIDSGLTYRLRQSEEVRSYGSSARAALSLTFLSNCYCIGPA